MILDQNSGTLKGLALILSIDGRAVQLLEIDLRPMNVRQSNKLELTAVPVYLEEP